METSIKNQSGGIAAETTKINSNPNNTKIPEADQNSVTLKVAAAMNGCAWTSLKNNIKTGKLVATQAGEKAPYIVRLSDVERFLRDTPGIASNFYPAADRLAGAMTTQADGPAKSEPAQSEGTPARPSSAAEVSVEQSARAHAVAGPDSNKPKHEASDHSQANRGPDVQTAPSAQAPTDGTRRRRRRRRGKGGGGSESRVKAEIQMPLLKALAGTTPQERLRITACLNELASLVASA